MGDGNCKEAYAIFRKLALDPGNNRKQVGDDLAKAVSCLQRLNRRNETDELREEVINAHPDNWRLLCEAARSYFHATHYGYIVAGDFHRGHHRGGGRYVNSFERDRIRALQLMTRALEKSAGETEKKELARFHLEFARILMGYRGSQEAWRLQYLSDLSELPDYDESGYRHYHHGPPQGAPVLPDGTPVYHRSPGSYQAARSDGERWRWMLNRAMELDPNRTNEILTTFAGFLQQQFGVQTIAHYGRFFPVPNTDKKDKTGTYALHTLGEDETIARLATGLKRFSIPREFSFIAIYRLIADSPKTGHAENALNTLASIFENRRQYDEALSYWKRSIKEYGDRRNGSKQKKIDQILGNWGQFEPVMTHPAGKEATVEFRFRNGRKVSFEAHEIRVKELLDDVKAYIKSNPSKLDSNKMRIGNIGYRLVERNEKRYVGPRTAAWKLNLEPRDKHFDKRITINTPLVKPGAYLLTAAMENGNVSKIVIWINDTVIVRKRLSNQAWFFIADAVTGKPLRKVNVEFFGYRQERVKKTRRYNVLVSNFAEYTDENGVASPSPKDFQKNYRWLITATTPEGRLAYLGFSGVWYSGRHDREYNQTKVFTITDRPVYRPNQAVKFKLWVRHAKYDKEDKSSFAGRSFTVQITDPRNEKVLEKSFVADAYGGFDGEYFVPEAPTLGVYRIAVIDPKYVDPRTGKSVGRRSLGGGNFRVEEYKKPEFEVKVEAPTEPVMLGEKITATINAMYYFGAPVTKAKVKYKILRSTHSERWYPVGIWDWFYGRGYWWFGHDYEWYPGWAKWGCPAPWPWWCPPRLTPPEVVAEVETRIGSDGTVKVEIDTAVAKELHGDTDHKYEITVEVTDESRRTIVGKGNVLVARKPFKVHAWVNRGHYRVGDVIRADFNARTLDGKPVQGKGKLALYRITYQSNMPSDKRGIDPVETLVRTWVLDTDDEGRAQLQIKASRAGQYRLSYTVTDAGKHAMEGAYVFCVMGKGFDGKDFRFNEIELIPDSKESAPGDKVRLMINTDRADTTVVLFVRPANGIYPVPKIVRMEGKSTVEEIAVTKKDMPNFFVEAFTISDGRLYSATREIIVPPEKRVLNVDVLPSSETYRPGEKAAVKVRLTDFFGKPFAGSAVISVYDKSVEYISGGSNVPEIRAFFWKWRRRHNPRTASSFDRHFRNLALPKAVRMQSLGAFGHLIVDEFGRGEKKEMLFAAGSSGKRGRLMKSVGTAVHAEKSTAPPAPLMEMNAVAADSASAMQAGTAGGAAPPDVQQPVVRKEFADTAFWNASIDTDKDGIAEVAFRMPENLTGWKVKTWAMGHGTKVGEGTADVVTTKNLLLRLQAPRFFTEKDEVVLSANIHNYLKNKKTVRAVLELDGPCLEIMPSPRDTISRRSAAETTLDIHANGEQRVDWRVKVVREGEAVVRMKALTDEESDAMEMRFPVYVHGMLKTDSFCGVIRRNMNTASIEINVPGERRVDQSRLEIRYSPTLAGAMVDALPYLVEYPYGCTEQTLNRFLPTVITQKILKDMGLDLKAIRDKQTNLNAQEIGDDKERAKQWKRWDRNPVFDEDTVLDMVKQGLKQLTAMQLSDGGWGWFSGRGERSYPHTTALVVHGLQIATQNGVAVVPGVLQRGTAWLQNYQARELRKLDNAPKKKDPWKNHADNLDAFVYMALADAGLQNSDMREYLYRDRNYLAVYAKAMYGMALHRQGHKEKLAMILRNIEQYLVQDPENQTAWLNLPNGGYWWCWYGSEHEAHAYYLKLLALTDPKGDRAAGLVKYLLNNRKHATYWNSTRDTALCVEAMADYLRASEEDKPDMTVEIYVDGRKRKEVRITPANLFMFDNRLVISGKAVESGKHTIEIRRKGSGPVYFNAYLTNFTLEDFITRAGLEIKVRRKYYKLNPLDKAIKVAGSRGQALDQKVEKYERQALPNLSSLKSGDLAEIELEMESKNDYEYIVFEDMKAAGFEPVEVRSGYSRKGLRAYVEFRDERVCFFVRRLARGRHSLSYRMRAEIPGRFSALPARAYAMYAPELKANSDEIKLSITD